MPTNYDLHPAVRISDESAACLQGWNEIEHVLQSLLSGRRDALVVVETYPGIDMAALSGELRRALPGCTLLTSEDAFYPPERLREVLAGALRDDPVFNYMQPWTIDVYFDPAKLEAVRAQVAAAIGVRVVIGTGASRVVEQPDLLMSANVGRWELQRRQRQGLIANLGLLNLGASPMELYKHAFFLDWRIADRLRHQIYSKVDLFLDLDDQACPSAVSGKILRNAVRQTVQQPFRVVPFFDPGPWGGQWMRRRFGLPEGPPNYAWGFDCVPEENSVSLAFGTRRFALPAIVLVQEEPDLLLGEVITSRFGAEFPIRFDFLDTVEGGNLSLQVHPTAAYIHEHFCMAYTQDESYYMLHCEPDSAMYLGLQMPVDREKMSEALQQAQDTATAFPAERFIAHWPTRKHDHFSIPAGTVHCAGAGSVVLEISATPYIFTFKLYDWERNGLDGRPRPIHLEHGLANIDWSRNEAWVRAELIDQTVSLAEGPGWREERTGLHRTEFLETRRHWFTQAVPHNTEGNLHVLNLVEGEAAVVSSPTNAFRSMTVHFAETFIVPASVGAYEVHPMQQTTAELATIKAYVRPTRSAPAAQTRNTSMPRA